MGKARLEAFSDGVIAIIITIMVLEFKVPQEATLEKLLEMLPLVLSYVLSFLLVALMWVNHHALLGSAQNASRSVIWANMNLLFWMSLIPFSTAFMGENHLAPLAVSLYGVVLGINAVSFTPLRLAVAAQHKDHDALQQHHRRVLLKNFVSPLLYFGGAALAEVSVWVSLVLYLLVPVMYFFPQQHPTQKTSS
jgi:uncharacterized membrane protein